jgi:hypothetical protein
VISFSGFGRLQLYQTIGPIQLGPFIAEHQVGYQEDSNGDTAERKVIVI